VPSPGERELLLKLRATSLCQSDVGVISGQYGPGVFPVIGGHEAIGIVAALGPGASSYGFKVGDFVGATAWHGACLECSGCSYGRQYCGTLKVKGISAPGYFAEYSVLDASMAIPVTLPEGVSPETLAPTFCAGITVWDALERAKIRPAETIAIIGVGGLGQLAIKYAAALGATVIALDVRDEQLEACKAPNGTGASHTINTSGLTGPELSKRVREVNGGKLLSCVIVTAGALQAYAATFPLIAPEGRLIAVGIPSGPIPVSQAYLSMSNISLIGAKVGGPESAKRCLEFTLSRKLYSKIHPRKFVLEDLNEMIDLMKAGVVENGRMVISFE